MNELALIEPKKPKKPKRAHPNQLAVFHSNKDEQGNRPQNWATPFRLYCDIEDAFAGGRGFLLDACAESWNAKAPFYFDESLDALNITRPWHLTGDVKINARWFERFAPTIEMSPDQVGVWCMDEARTLLDMHQGDRDVWVWCNPPYNAIDHFIRKAIRELDAGAYKGCAFLIPHRTDRSWWHELVKPRAWHVEAIEGRVAFDVPPEVEITADGGYEPSAVVVFRGGIRGVR